MHYGVERADSIAVMRKKAFAGESLLWETLSKGVCGLWFRRRYPIGNHIVDFYCRRLKLIIEISKTGEPKERDLYLKASGYTILRFSDSDIIKNMPRVITGLQSTIRNKQIILRLAAIGDMIRGFSSSSFFWKNGRNRTTENYILSTVRY